MADLKNKQSIALIGMAGVGKTSFGKLLAAELNYPFIDTDHLLEKKIQTSLQTFIETHGQDQFLQNEEYVLCELTLKTPSIIATGGSAIYTSKGMAHLKKIATIVWLKDSPSNIKNRIQNLQTRGLINPSQKPFHELYQERETLYKRYAEKIIEFPKHFSHKIILNQLKELL